MCLERNKLAGKKVIIFLWYFDIGGAELQALLLAKYLRKRYRMKVVFCGLRYKQRLAEILDKEGFVWRIFPIDIGQGRIKNSIKFFFLSLKIRMFFSPDIIMAYTYLPNLICGNIWRMTGARVFIWNQRDVKRNFVGSELEKKALQKTPVFVANSLEAKISLEGRINKEKKVLMIQNGLTLDYIQLSKTQCRKKLNLPIDSFIAIKTANITTAKNHSLLINAWEKFLKHNKNEKNKLLLLAGRYGDAYNEIKKHIEEKQLQDSVIFLNFITDIRYYLKASDIMIFSSNSESNPNAVIEGMFYGLPIIATNIHATRDILGNKYPLLTPTNKPTLMSEKIMLLYKHPKLAQQVGRANQINVSQRFDNERMVSEYFKLFYNVLYK